MTGRIFTGGLTMAALALTGALGACDSPAPEPTTSAAERESPDNPPGISLSDALVQMPAVAGRPGVAYFTVSQSSGPARSIASVAVEGVGRTEMHESTEKDGVASMAPVESVPIESGKSVVFKPGGYHVMLFDIDARTRFEKQTELTVIFDNGDKASVAAKVGSVSTEMQDMEGMR